MVDLDVAGFARVTAGGIEIEKAPEGVTFEPLPEEHERLYSLVGWDEKFAAHNAALWKHGLLVVVPKGVVLEKPLYVRIAATGQTFWRLVVVAEEGARASLDRGVRVAGARHGGLLERGHGALRRAGREARVRLAPEPLARDVALRDRTTRASSATPSSTGSPAGFGSKKGQDADPERPERAAAPPRASPARTSPTARSTSTTTRSRSTSRPTASRTSPSRARSATRRRRSGAG